MLRRLLLTFLACLTGCASNSARDSADALPKPADSTATPALPRGLPSGQLVYIDRDASIVAVDLASQQVRRFPMKGVLPVDMTLAPDGSGQLAFVATPKDDAPAEVRVLDLSSGAQRGLETPHEPYVVQLRWGGGGTLLYRTFDDRRNAGKSHHFAIASNAPAGRLLSREGWVAAAEHGSRIAYSECIELKADWWDCVHRLVVDDASGGAARVLGEHLAFDPVGFTPDGRYLLVTERIKNGHHVESLVRYALDGSGRLDLGELSRPSMWFPSFSSWISRDSSEVIVHRDDKTVVVKLDGSGERTIGSSDISMAGFIHDKGVLYQETKVLRGDGCVPSYVSALGYVDGDRRVLLADFADCGLPVVSRSGALVAQLCNGGIIHMYSLETAALVAKVVTSRALNDTNLLGFDGNDLGLVVAYGPDSALSEAEHVLRWHGLDGSLRELGTSYTHRMPKDRSAWPPFAFTPGGH